MSPRAKQILLGAVCSGLVGALASFARSPAPRPQPEEPAPVVGPYGREGIDALHEKQTLEALQFSAPHPASAASAP